MTNKARCTFEAINTFRSIVFSIPHVTFLYTYFKKFVGENDECQLSNGDCTTEKKYGYWILIRNSLPWCRLHTVPTFDDESYGLSLFFRIQWLRLHCSYAFVKGQWNAISLNFWWTVMLSRSRLTVHTAAREELTVFAYQIWKPQFLSVVQSTFNNCYSPFPPTTFLEMGVYTKAVDSVERARWVRVSFAIHLRIFRGEFALENVGIFAGNNELKSHFRITLSSWYSTY